MTTPSHPDTIKYTPSRSTLYKKCSKCKLIMPIIQFASDSKKFLGLSCQCLRCHRIRLKEYRQSHKNIVRKRIKCYWKTHPKEIRANWLLQTWVRTGKIIKPNRCSYCMKKTFRYLLHGHHPDYGKPTEVVWLCPRCHKKEHAK